MNILLISVGLGFAAAMYIMAGAANGQLLPTSVAVIGGTLVTIVGTWAFSVNKGKRQMEIDAHHTKKSYQNFPTRLVQ
jgi:putative Mn2+ efflux pump MntP